MHARIQNAEEMDKFVSSLLWLLKNVKDRTNLKKIYSEGDMNYTK